MWGPAAIASSLGRGPDRGCRGTRLAHPRGVSRVLGAPQTAVKGKLAVEECGAPPEPHIDRGRP